MRTRRTENKSRSIVSAIAFGTLVSIGIMIACGAVLSTTLLSETIGMDSSGVVAVAITFVSAFIGAMIALKVAVGDNRLLVVACTSISLIFILLSGNILLFDGVFLGLGGTLVSILLGAGLSLLTNKGNRQRPTRRYKARSR